MRRDFLGFGAGLSISAFLGPRSSAATPTAPVGRARSCIFVYLLGGPPHLDMWDLKPDAPAEIRGPFRPIPTNTPGLLICEHLPRLARMADRYALVRSVSHNNHNHTPMIYYTLTGHPVERPEQDNDVRPPQRTDSPHVGAVIAHKRPVPAGLPGFVAIPELAVRSSTEGAFKRARMPLRGGAAGFLGPSLDPFLINDEPGASDIIPNHDVAGGRLDRREALRSLLEGRGAPLPGTSTYADLHRQAVVLTGTSGAMSRTLSIGNEPAAIQDRYGRHRFGKAMLLARRLAEAGVPTVTIHFNEMTLCDGWDTHAQNFAALKDELLPMLDQGLSALLDDLNRRGTLDETLVAVMGEFGRTPRINKDAGRDHWGSCQSVLLAGGGIRGGQVYGASDRIGAYPASEPVDPADIHATIYHGMGIDPAGLIHDQLGRPYSICTGRPLTALM